MFEKYNSKKSRNASCEHILKISEEWVAAIPRVWSNWEVPRLPNGRLLLGAPSSSPGWPWWSPASWSWPRTARRSTSPGSSWCTASSQWSPGYGRCWPVLTGRYMNYRARLGSKLESWSPSSYTFYSFLVPNFCLLPGFALLARDQIVTTSGSLTEIIETHIVTLLIKL